MRKSLCFIIFISIFIYLMSSTTAVYSYEIFNVTGKRLSDNSTVNGHLEVLPRDSNIYKVDNITVAGIIVNKDNNIERVVGNHIENGMYRLSGGSGTYEVRKRE